MKPWPKLLGEERVDLVYASISLFSIKGNPDRNSNRAGTSPAPLAGADAEAMEACYLLACSYGLLSLLIEPRTTDLGMRYHPQ